MNNILLIPAYNPEEDLLQLIEQLNTGEFKAILVVNDGSLPEKKEIFNKLSLMESVIIIDHAFNQGKGAALKTAFNYILNYNQESCGVITADADGQHSVKDIIKISQELTQQKDVLLIGTRTFSTNVPLRSYVGNMLTRMVMKGFFKIDINDTQSGLRGIPLSLLTFLITIPFNRYEFETEMIMVASHHGVKIKEISIETIYMDNNAGSSFNPIIDSIKIYFVLFRYIFASLLTAFIDYFVFFISFSLLGKIFLSTYLARFFALFVNFFVLKRFVFHSRKNTVSLLSRYLFIVIITGFLSSSLIDYFSNSMRLNVLLSKIIAELLLYFGIFFIQKDFVFKTEEVKMPKKTNWNSYYNKPYKTASLTRKITSKVLINTIKNNIADKKELSVIELGGANSAFLKAVNEKIKPKEYLIIDNNQAGLNKTKSRIVGKDHITILNQDILSMSLDHKVDLIFSVGLIEHFDKAGTKKAIESHFDLLKPGGIAIFTFPTPTFLYKIVRFISEKMGLWIFHDERPILFDEVYETARTLGEKKSYKIIWPIMLTQGIAVFQKR